jgi:TIR domain-containing protein
VDPQIFITYSSKDQKVARTICTALENRGLACWISSRNVKPGQNYQEQIVKAIRAARVMVLVFTANANNSNEIKKELALASQNNLVVIPVRIEDVVPNEAFAYEFATRQWIDLFENSETSISELVELIAAIVDNPSAGDRSNAARGPTRDAAAPAFIMAGATPANKPSAPFMQRPATRWSMIAGLAVVVAGITYAVVTFSQRSSSTPVTATLGAPTSSGTPAPSTSPAPNQKAASSVAPVDISGKYSVVGTNPNGSTYHGSVTIHREGDRYRFDWLIANVGVYSGTGMLNGGSIVVDWGQQYPVIYQVGPNGVLTDTWNNGTATETLVPD